jgi:hemerythrin-like domain-containing protein
MSRSFPGFATPAAGFEAPFELLQACHERVERMLGLLQRLADYLTDHPRDAQARQAAHDVMRYFDVAAPLHHQDEELHVFPVLARQGDPSLRAILEQLQRDHLAMEAAWQALRHVLEAVISSPLTKRQALNAEELQCLHSFLALYQGHMATENSVVFPCVQRQLTEKALRQMSQDMMRRRGVASPNRHSE